MNYELYVNDEGQERVKFEDGNDFFVETNEYGIKYFSIPNLYQNNPENNPENDPFKVLFANRIKDAITAIREGHGDVLAMDGIFGKSERVYRFVDREYGENLRQRTIKGFENTVFGYSLKFCHSFIDENGFTTIGRDYVFFENEDEAKELKEKIIAKAKETADAYLKLKGDYLKQKEYLDSVFKDGSAVYLKIATEMMDEKDNTDMSAFLNVVQAIKPEKIDETCDSDN